jgi:ABC-type amino acid transport substrate-binding protein
MSALHNQVQPAKLPADIHLVQPDVITIGTYAAFAPVCWRDQGNASGKDIDFLRAFAALWGLDLDVRFFEFDNIWERPGQGEIDIAAAGIAPLPHRQTPGVLWTKPYYTVQRSLVIRAAERDVLQVMEDFGDRTIAVTQGSTADHDTCERKPASARIVYYNDQIRAIEDVLNGKIDAFGEGDVCGHYMASLHPGELAVVDIHQMRVPETFSFAVREASNLLEPLNAFISQRASQY